MSPALSATALTLTAFLAGCMPFITAESPAVASMRVVDADSKLPLPSARIFVKGRPETAVSADAKGVLNLESVRDHKWLPALPFDIIPQPLPLVVEAPGYRPTELSGENVGMMVKPIRDVLVELRKE